MPVVDILLPTYNRLTSLVMTLSGLAALELQDFHLIVADQSWSDVSDEPVIQALLRVIASRGATVEWHYHQLSLGIAEQREFLLQHSRSKMVLYLDDDVLMQPWVLAALVVTLCQEGCGFVGAFPAGLSFREDVRPSQQVIEIWEGFVQPEAVEPGRATRRWRPDRPDWWSGSMHEREE